MPGPDHGHQLGLRARHRHRPERDRTRIETRTVRIRPDARTPLGAALRIDRAGVWRAPPLRRGLIALTAAPALAAVVTGLDWPMLVLLPSLAASGAGLLFGVNALALDGPGAIWRESLPSPPRTMLLARILVIAEVCLFGLRRILRALREWSQDEGLRSRALRTVSAPA